MLLCGRTATLEREGVQEEIGLAEDLARELSDKKFIIPLRLEKYKKLFGISRNRIVLVTVVLIILLILGFLGI